MSLLRVSAKATCYHLKDFSAEALSDQGNDSGAQPLGE